MALTSVLFYLIFNVFTSFCKNPFSFISCDSVSMSLFYFYECYITLSGFNVVVFVSCICCVSVYFSFFVMYLNSSSLLCNDLYLHVLFL